MIEAFSHTQSRSGRWGGDVWGLLKRDYGKGQWDFSSYSNVFDADFEFVENPLLGSFQWPCLSTEHFSEQMFDGGKGMIDHHSRSGPSHHMSDFVFHLRPIAMNGAVFAGGLVCTEPTSVKAVVGIVQ